MKKRIISILSCLMILSMAFETCIAKEYIFPDIAWEGRDNRGKPIMVEYYVREITQASNIGFIDGYPDGTFKPLNNISREEFVKMLIVMATNWTFNFKEVDTEYSTWAGPYITIAEMQGIVDKNAYTLEEWRQPITRIEMVLMLAKTQINMKGIPQNQIGHLAYTDLKNLTQEEKDLVLHAAKYDLLEGMKDGTSTLFEPNKNLTRGEAAAALMRVY